MKNLLKVLHYDDPIPDPPGDDDEDEGGDQPGEPPAEGGPGGTRPPKP